MKNLGTETEGSVANVATDVEEAPATTGEETTTKDEPTGEPAPKKPAAKKSAAKKTPTSKKAAVKKAPAKKAAPKKTAVKKPAAAKAEPKEEARYELVANVKPEDLKRNKCLVALVDVAKKAGKPLTIAEFVDKAGNGFKSAKSLISYRLRKTPKVFRAAK